MITGTIYNAGKMLEMTQKWEQKKSSGNILKKEVKELSPEEQQLKMYQEQLEREREGNEYSSIYAKIQSGQELSPAEEDKLRAKDPKMYMEYKADRMEQEAYEKKLKNCKTKEEAERLHVNRMNGKLSELKSIVNNPNIPKSEKLKEAQRILGDTTKTSLDRVGRGMSGSDVIIAPNILEQMATDSDKAAYYENKIDYYFNTAIPRDTLAFASKGLVYEPGGVVVHEDGNDTYNKREMEVMA